MLSPRLKQDEESKKRELQEKALVAYRKMMKKALNWPSKKAVSEKVRAMVLMKYNQCKRLGISEKELDDVFAELWLKSHKNPNGFAMSRIYRDEMRRPG